MTKRHCDICDRVVAMDYSTVGVDFKLESRTGHSLRGGLRPKSSNGNPIDICIDCIREHFLNGTPAWSFPLINIQDGGGK